MAKLDILQRKPEKIVLGKGGAKGVGSLIGLLIFVGVICAGLGPLFEEGETVNPVMWVIGFIVVISLFSTIASVLRSTRVVIDGHAQRATREDTLFFLPLRRQNMALNTIRDVSVSAPRSRPVARLKDFSLWQVELRGVDGAALLVNERGAYAEMRALADQVGALLNRPVHDAAALAASARPSVPARQVAERPAHARQALPPSAADAAIAQTSARMAQESAEANAAVATVTAQQAAQQSAAEMTITQTSARMAQESAAANAPILQASAMQLHDQARARVTLAPARAAQTQAQISASLPAFETGMQMAFSQLSAFEGDAAARAQMADASAAAGMPFVESSARLAQQQNQATFTIEYALPPMAGLGQMPALATFAPMMDLPALEPLTLGATSLSGDVMAFPETATEFETAAGVETIKGETRSGRAETAALLQKARQLQRQGNFGAAKQAYEAALDADPSSVEIHNDFGVLFFSQAKMAEAERVFRQTIALDPFYAPGRYNLGVTLQRQGKRKAATEQFRLGAQNASGLAQEFENALRGHLQAPLLSA